MNTHPIFDGVLGAISGQPAVCNKNVAEGAERFTGCCDKLIAALREFDEAYAELHYAQGGDTTKYRDASDRMAKAVRTARTLITPENATRDTDNG